MSENSQNENIPNKEHLENVIDDIMGRINFYCQTDEDEDTLTCLEEYYEGINADPEEVWNLLEDNSLDKNEFKYVVNRLKEELKSFINDL